MHRECRERFPCHLLQRKRLISDPTMHHGTCVTHVPWCMVGSLICCGGENVPGIPGACAPRNFTYLARGLYCLVTKIYIHIFIRHISVHQSTYENKFAAPNRWLHIHVCGIHYIGVEKVCHEGQSRQGWKHGERENPVDRTCEWYTRLLSNGRIFLLLAETSEVVVELNVRVVID